MGCSLYTCTNLLDALINIKYLYNKYKIFIKGYRITNILYLHTSFLYKGVSRKFLFFMLSFQSILL